MPNIFLSKKTDFSTGTQKYGNILIKPAAFVLVARNVAEYLLSAAHSYTAAEISLQVPPLGSAQPHSGGERRPHLRAPDHTQASLSAPEVTPLQHRECYSSPLKPVFFFLKPELKARLKQIRI